MMNPGAFASNLGGWRVVFPIVLAAALLIGCDQAQAPRPDAPAERSKPPQIGGTYVLDDPAIYGFATMKEVPPGQVLRLGIGGGRWMMYNMLSAWGGPYTETPSGATLVTTESPSGPVAKPESVSATFVGSGLKLETIGAPDSSQPLRFTRISDDAPEESFFDAFLGPKGGSSPSSKSAAPMGG